MMKYQSIPQRKAAAIISAVISFFLLACVSILIKLQEQKASIQWIIFIQFSTGLIVMTVIASTNKFRDLKTSKIKYHIIRATMGVFAFAASAVAMTKIPLVNAVLMNNSAPLFIPIITLLWLHEKIDERIWFGIITGFIGIIFILKPNSHNLIKTGDLFGLSSGIFLAIAYVALKILTKTESITSVAFYYSLTGVILSIPFATLNWSTPPLLIWVYGIASGICLIGYMFLLQNAYKFMEAIKLSPFNYLVIVFTGIFDWLIFDQIPDIYSVIGIILVSTGGLIAIMLHEKNNKKLKHHWL